MRNTRETKEIDENRQLENVPVELDLTGLGPVFFCSTLDESMGTADHRQRFPLNWTIETMPNTV
jgi:hypothetical protein